MALTITTVDVDTIWGNKYIDIVDITFDSSYPAGGEALAPSNLGRGAILGAIPLGGNAAAAGLIIEYITATGKLMVKYPTGGAEDSPAALAAPAIVLAAGSGTPDSGTITPGVGKEVLATTDLSTVTKRFAFICI